MAAGQFGLISRAQALACGLSNEGLHRRMASGHWRRVHAGVYAVGAPPDSWEFRAMGARLWSPKAPLSYESAGRVWRLDDVDDGGLISLTKVGGGRAREDGVVLHSTQALKPSEFGRVGPWLVTSPIRTTFDLAAVIGDDDVLENCAETFARRDESFWARLSTAVAASPGRGREGIARLRRFIAARDPNAAPTESMFETKFFRLLRRGGLPLPERQVRVFVDGIVVARLDFAYTEAMLGIPTDGYSCHSGRKAWLKGIEQDTILMLQGWRLLHTTWRDLVERPDVVVARIREALGRESGT